MKRTTCGKDPMTMPFSLFNFGGTILVGGTMVLMIWAVAHTVKRPVPRWLYPTAAGASMIAFQIYNDYTWFDRTVDALPPDHVVVATYGNASPLQPWSFAVTMIDRFALVDRGSIKRNPAIPDVIVADMLLVTRFLPTARVTQFFDCAGHRRADAHAGIVFDDKGNPTNAEWTPIAADDAALAAVCRAD